LKKITAPNKTIIVNVGDGAQSRALTLKKSFDDPESIVPYLMSVCLARSSADSMGDCIRSAVKNAAKLAVYEEMRINVKNHQTLPTIRPDIDLYHNEYDCALTISRICFGYLTFIPPKEANR